MKRKLASMLVVFSFLFTVAGPIQPQSPDVFTTLSDYHGG